MLAISCFFIHSLNVLKPRFAGLILSLAPPAQARTWLKGKKQAESLVFFSVRNYKGLKTNTVYIGL